MNSSVSFTIYLDFRGRKTNLTPKLNVPLESFYSEKTFSEPAKIEPTENPPSKQVCVTFIQNRCIFKSPWTISGKLLWLLFSWLDFFCSFLEHSYDLQKTNTQSNNPSDLLNNREQSLKARVSFWTILTRVQKLIQFYHWGKLNKYKRREQENMKEQSLAVLGKDCCR